jgi:hypothetical protein
VTQRLNPQSCTLDPERKNTPQDDDDDESGDDEEGMRGSGRARMSEDMWGLMSGGSRYRNALDPRP